MNASCPPSALGQPFPLARVCIETHLATRTLFGALMTHARLSTLVAAALIGLPLTASAQQPAAPQPEVGPKVGEMAPDFEFTGITRFGKLANSQKLSDLRGQTVVLAFFPKARTKG